MPNALDAESKLNPTDLWRLQWSKFQALLAAVFRSNQFWQARLKSRPSSAEQFSQIPLLTRDDLLEDQVAHPPYGSNLTYPLHAYTRLHQTSGTTTGAPLRCLDSAADWDWWKSCWTAIYRAAQIEPADRLFFPFSFGPFIGFWAAFESAISMGNLCLPAGGMTTSARLRFLLENEATVICCTPTYALHLAEVARTERVDLAASPVRSLIVAGEPGGSVPAMRKLIESGFGARVFDHVGMTEVGAYAFECVECPGGLHVNESEFIAEVINPATCEVLDTPLLHSARPASTITEGELILTNLGRMGFPLIRYRTGDIVRLSRGECRCGRTFARLEGGILGRSDDMLIIRGNNVFPSAIDAILRQFEEVVEYRLTLGRHEGLADLLVEIEPVPTATSSDLVVRVTHALKDRFNFRPHVALVTTGTLPRFEMKARRVVRGN